MRRIGFITTSRAEYGSLVPLLRLVEQEPDLKLILFVGGMHLDPRLGMTVQRIEQDGFQISERIPMQITEDTPEGIGKSMGQGLTGFTEALARQQPDIVVLVGDRSEMLTAAMACLVLQIPVLHISGGDITEGSTDNQVRYALTKLSHLHCVAMESHGRRIYQVGEEPWRIYVTGEPALDSIPLISPLDRSQLSEYLGSELISPIVLATLHPSTLTATPVEKQINSLLGALEDFPGTVIFTGPNGDAGSQLITDYIEDFVRKHSNAYLKLSAGQQVYYGLLSVVDVMIGNSSSGIWEAPSFELPVVNIGERQAGRHRAANVIDVPFDDKLIRAALYRALTPEFRVSLHGIDSPYGDGQASKRILAILKKPFDLHVLLLKKFVDMDIEIPEDF